MHSAGLDQSVAKPLRFSWSSTYFFRHSASVFEIWCLIHILCRYYSQFF